MADLQVIDDGEAQEPAEESPILRQWRKMKANQPDRLLLFRSGDYYESYGDDAEECASILHIALTKQDGLRVAGFPHHTLDTYLPKLCRAGKRVAICDQLTKADSAESTETKQNNSSNSKTSTTMETKKNNESKNTVNNTAIEDVNVGEVTVDSIQPAMVAEVQEQAPATKSQDAVEVPVSPHGTLVVGGIPTGSKPKGVMPKVTIKRKKSSGDQQPKAQDQEASGLSTLGACLSERDPRLQDLPPVHLVTFTTKRGEIAPRIVGFADENDPRWRRHYDDRMALAKAAKEAKAKDPKAKTHSDPFGASWFTDHTTGAVVYCMTLGTRYMDEAKGLCEAYNSGDATAIIAAEKAVIDMKAGIVAGFQAERAARQKIREAKKAAREEAKKTAKAADAKAGYSDEDVAEMLRKVLAGGKVPENIKKLLKAA